MTPRPPLFVRDWPGEADHYDLYLTDLDIVGLIDLFIEVQVRVDIRTAVGEVPRAVQRARPSLLDNAIIAAVIRDIGGS